MSTEINCEFLELKSLVGDNNKNHNCNLGFEGVLSNYPCFHTPKNAGKPFDVYRFLFYVNLPQVIDNRIRTPNTIPASFILDLESQKKLPVNTDFSKYDLGCVGRLRKILNDNPYRFSNNVFTGIKLRSKVGFYIGKDSEVRNVSINLREDSITPLKTVYFTESEVEAVKVSATKSPKANGKSPIDEEFGESASKMFTMYDESKIENDFVKFSDMDCKMKVETVILMHKRTEVIFEYKDAVTGEDMVVFLTDISNYYHKVDGAFILPKSVFERIIDFIKPYSLGANFKLMVCGFLCNQIGNISFLPEKQQQEVANFDKVYLYKLRITHCTLYVNNEMVRF